MTYSTIRYAIDEARVATLAFNRPDQLNPISFELLAESRDALDRAVRDGARALIFTGEGRAFSAGADLKGGLPDDLGAMLDEYYHPFIKAMDALPFPVVTALNGLAAGAGMGFALLGDIIVAARSSYLLLAFVNIGLVPDAGSTWLVAKAVGRAKALELAMLGEKLSAEDALAAGLVTRVVDDEKVMEEATAIARRLAAMPTKALGMIRSQVRTALSSTLDETLEVEHANQTIAGRTADFREAAIAFIEKRKPVFRGE